ncbi:MAG: His/Gly/Thr/Pro-type tRNA ligase C-terminal domain-containing protein, partial [bacterium]
SEKMGAVYLDEDGKQKPYMMGCYGIGVSRIAGAIIEQNYDDFGIKWPLSISPYKVALVPVNIKEKEQSEVAEKLYDDLKAAGVEVILDDRDASVGVKLKDIDLIGFPIKVIIGPKSLAEKKIEIKSRVDGKTQMIPIDEAAKKLTEICR